METSTRHNQNEYGYLRRLPSDKLRELLALAPSLSDRPEDEAYVDALEEAIIEREKENPTGFFPDVDRQWEQFAAHYLPETDQAASEPEPAEHAVTPQTNRHVPRKRVIRLRQAGRTILAAAAVVICAFIPDAENASMSEHYSGQFVPYIEDDAVVRMDNSGITLIGKNNPVFKQDDIDTNFVNYASGESRNTLPNVYTGIDSEVSNVVGVVLDFETDEPIGEAIVSANGNDIVVTDIDGRFQITNMPDGIYDWTIQADGYQDGIYENYVVTSAGGTNIYRFYLSKEMEYINPFEEYT